MRRKFATELKAVPLGDLAYLGGWQSAQTILKCYQQPDDLTLRSALDGAAFWQRPVSNSKSPRKFCAGFYSNLLGKA